MNEVEPPFGDLARPLAGGAGWAGGTPVDRDETSSDVVLPMAVPGIAVDDLDVRVGGRQPTPPARAAAPSAAHGTTLRPVPRRPSPPRAPRR
jgi:hypothetical protein